MCLLFNPLVFFRNHFSVILVEVLYLYCGWPLMQRIKVYFAHQLVIASCNLITVRGICGKPCVCTGLGYLPTDMYPVCTYACMLLSYVCTVCVCVCVSTCVCVLRYVIRSHFVRPISCSYLTSEWSGIT